MTKLEKLLMLIQTGLNVYQTRRGSATDAEFRLIFATATLNDFLTVMDRIDEASLPDNLGSAASEYILWQDGRYNDRPDWFPE